MCVADNVALHTGVVALHTSCIEPIQDGQLVGGEARPTPEQLVGGEARLTPLLTLGQVNEEGTGEKGSEHKAAPAREIADDQIPWKHHTSSLSTQGSEAGETSATQQTGQSARPVAAASFKTPTLFKSAFTGKLWHSQELNAGAALSAAKCP